MEKQKFDNFVSLGSKCPVASSMSKYGLRSWSGVFDWLITQDFRWVLYNIENDFESFLSKENLEMYQDNPKKFRDVKTGFVFIHEELLFIEEFELLERKYRKRIETFLNETKKRTCFFRAVESNEEAEYIRNNYEYIDRVIKKQNNNSELVLLLKSTVTATEFPFRTFNMRGEYSGASRQLLRGWFDDEIELLEFCGSNSDAITIIKNIMFDSKTEDKFNKNLYKMLENTKDRYERDKEKYEFRIKMLEHNWDKVVLPEKLIIYGAGTIGKAFYKAVNKKCCVCAFVDTNRQFLTLENVPVLTFDEIDLDESIPYVVTVNYDFEVICKTIRKHNKNAKIFRLEDFIN